MAVVSPSVDGADEAGQVQDHDYQHHEKPGGDQDGGTGREPPLPAGSVRLGRCLGVGDRGGGIVQSVVATVRGHVHDPLRDTVSMSSHGVVGVGMEYNTGVPKLWEGTIDAHREAVRSATLDAVAALIT